MIVQTNKGAVPVVKLAEWEENRIFKSIRIYKEVSSENGEESDGQGGSLEGYQVGEGEGGRLGSGLRSDGAF